MVGMQVCCCRTACPNLICWYVVVELESLLVALDCYRILLATVPPVGYPHTRLAHLTPLYNRHSKLGCCKEDYSSIPTDPDYGLVVVHVQCRASVEGRGAALEAAVAAEAGAV